MARFLTWLKAYLWKVLVAIDQLGNVVFCDGDPDETISSHAAKSARRGKRWGCVLCKLLHVVDKNHCENNIEPDEGRPTPPLAAV